MRACVHTSKCPSDQILIIRAVSSQIIVAFSYNLVEMFTKLSRCVMYKTDDSMSKVKVTLRGLFFLLLYLVQAITSQVINVL